MRLNLFLFPGLLYVLQQNGGKNGKSVDEIDADIHIVLYTKY